MNIKLAVATLALSLSGFVSISVASGNIDPLFAPVPSKTPEQSSVAGQIVQPDGRIVIWGGNLAVDSKFGQIIRLEVNGTPDTGFNYCGCHLNSTTSVIRQSDGKLLVAGSGLDYFGRIVRLNADGSQDPSFVSALGGFSHIQSTAEVIAVQSDGRIFATVSGQVGGGFHSGYLVRLNSDGSVDPSFAQLGYDGGRTIWGSVGAIELDAFGRYYLAIVTSSGFSSTITLRRYASNGTIDSTWEFPTFGSGGFQSISDLALQGDGSLLASGSFSTVNGVAKSNFVRFLPAGNVDLGFTGPAPGIGGGGAIAVLQNGKILVTSAGQLVRLNTDGSTDTGFSHPAGITSVVTRFSLDPNERIVLYGQSNAGGYKLYRLEANGPIDTGFDPNLTILAEVYAQARQADGKLVVAGTFTQVNGVTKQSVARLNADGSLDASFDGGTGFSSPPNTISVLGDGKIVAAGGFSSYNGIPQPGLTRLNADGSLDAAFAPTVTSVRGATVLSDGKLMIYGGFSTVNGVTRERIAKLNSDGSLDNSVAAAISSGSVYSVAQLASGGFIVGGSFTGVDGFNRSNLVRLNANGTLDQSFNASGVATVDRVLAQPDGKIVCVYGAGSPSGVGRRLADGSNDAGFLSPTFASNNSDLRIYSVALQSDGSLLLGGNFYSVNNTLRDNLVRLGSNGMLDRLFLPAGANATVRSLLMQPDGTVYVAGDYARLNAVSRAGLARVAPGAFTRVVPFDFDGDGKADVAVFRPTENKWYILRSSDAQVTQTVFAIPNDRPAPSDYDGDGKTDIAIYRGSAGDWWSLSTIANSQVYAHLGAAGDIPLPSDITGDGRSDYVVYRPSNFTWYRVASSNGANSQIQFGAAGDKPVIGDVDGDGKTEPVIFRPSTGDWWWQSSVDSVQRAVHWGIASDIPSAADFDGDGKTDFAVYRPSEGIWYIRNSADDSYTIVRFGLAEDKPVPADYDGDGRADIAVYRPSSGVWYLLRSTDGFAAYQFGIATDIPAQNAFVPQ